MFEMKIEKPVSESKLPPAKKGGHYKHLPIYEAVMKLAPGMLLPVVCESEEKAKKFGFAIQHSAFASFRSFVRNKTVYIRLRNEKDEAERKHIRELREKARQRKTGRITNLTNNASKASANRQERQDSAEQKN